MPIPPPQPVWAPESPTFTESADHTYYGVTGAAYCPNASYWDAEPVGRIVVTKAYLAPRESFSTTYPKAGYDVSVEINKIMETDTDWQYKADMVGMFVGQSGDTVNAAVKVQFVGRHNGAEVIVETPEASMDF